jgi:hypothetical protein
VPDQLAFFDADSRNKPRHCSGPLFTSFTNFFPNSPARSNFAPRYACVLKD